MSDIEKIKKQIQREYGDEALFTLEDIEYPPVNVISTGSFILDYKVLGVGGIPRGRVTELSGKEGIGKTTICLHLCLSAMSSGLMAAYIDAEHKLDIPYAKNIGVDTDSLLISHPEDGEIALDVADSLCSVNGLGLIVFDSAAALGSKEEREGEFTDTDSYAKVPRMLNKFLRRNVSKIRRNDIAVVFTNQLRDDIGSYWGGTKTTGGHGLQHYSSVLFALGRRKDIKENGEVIGQQVEGYTKKNNVAPPYRSAKFDIYYNKGIDYVADLFNTAVKLGVVKKRSSWYSYNRETLGQGKVACTEIVREKPELLKQIEEEVINGIKESSS